MKAYKHPLMIHTTTTRISKFILIILLFKVATPKPKYSPTCRVEGCKLCKSNTTLTCATCKEGYYLKTYTTSTGNSTYNTCHNIRELVAYIAFAVIGQAALFTLILGFYRTWCQKVKYISPEIHPRQSSAARHHNDPIVARTQTPNHKNLNLNLPSKQPSPLRNQNEMRRDHPKTTGNNNLYMLRHNSEADLPSTDRYLNRTSEEANTLPRQGSVDQFNPPSLSFNQNYKRGEDRDHRQGGDLSPRHHPGGGWHGSNVVPHNAQQKTTTGFLTKARTVRELSPPGLRRHSVTIYPPVLASPGATTQTIVHHTRHRGPFQPEGVLEHQMRLGAEISPAGPPGVSRRVIKTTTIHRQGDMGMQIFRSFGPKKFSTYVQKQAQGHPTAPVLLNSDHKNQKIRLDSRETNSPPQLPSGRRNTHRDVRAQPPTLRSQEENYLSPQKTEPMDSGSKPKYGKRNKITRGYYQRQPQFHFKSTQEEERGPQRAEMMVHSMMDRVPKPDLRNDSLDEIRSAGLGSPRLQPGGVGRGAHHPSSSLRRGGDFEDQNPFSSQKVRIEGDRRALRNITNRPDFILDTESKDFASGKKSMGAAVYKHHSQKKGILKMEMAGKGGLESLLRRRVAN